MILTIKSHRIFELFFCLSLFIQLPFEYLWAEKRIQYSLKAEVLNLDISVVARIVKANLELLSDLKNFNFKGPKSEVKIF